MRRTIGLILLMGLVLLGCRFGDAVPGAGARNSRDSGTGATPVIIRLGHGTSQDSLYHFGAMRFAELVAEKTDGRVKVEVYSDGQIGHDAELLEGMKIGSIDAGMIGLEPLTVVAPKLKIVNLPYLFTSREAAYKVLDGEIGQEMVADLPATQQIRVLAFYENGFRHLTNSKRPVRTPSDIKGLKIRVPQSPVSIEFIKTMGGIPTPMSFGEVYSALQQGVVDGQENPLALIKSAKFYEVNKYISLTRHMYSPYVLVFSEHTWQKLSGADREAILEAARESRDAERKESEAREEELITELRELGAQIYEVEMEMFIEAVKPIHEKIAAEIGREFYERVVAAAQ